MVEREYSLTPQWVVTLKGERAPVGRVVTVDDGYQAQPDGDVPLYPHLPGPEQHGIAHGTIDGAAEELLTWARGREDHPTDRFYPVGLEAAS